MRMHIITRCLQGIKGKIKMKNTNHKDTRKKYLSINEDDEYISKAAKLLDKAGRRQAVLLGIMADLFMDSFGIDENVSTEHLKKIIQTYDIVKNLNRKNYQYVLPKHEVSIPLYDTYQFKEKTAAEKPVTNETNNKEPDMDELSKELEDVLAGFQT